ncbi:hypothetical protein SFRURICE_013328 [Spodoptera frugiperda]|nr:hypothetical protein SFRURICE_013328 [Spodoptera frugiperda]
MKAKNLLYLLAMVPILFILGLTVVAALPNGIYLRRAPGPRYQHVQDGLGRLHLVDLWQPATDFNARYYPDTENVYHLFTRLNPSVSQPIVPGNEQLLKASNFDASRRTAVLIHGWLDNATGNFNAVLLAAFLAAEDMNVIVVDWSAGSSTFNFNQVRENTVLSGGAVARVISWINSVTGADLADYHIAGYSLGGQQAGMAGRNLGGKVGYITGLDPAGGPGFVGFEHTFRASDAVYTEVMHTNVGGAGCFHYFAESIRDGGFTGVKCESYKHALVGDCHLPETLNMGGLEPKTGKTGVYYLETNAASPFSKG